jgi:hypothetical protein
MMKRIFVVMLMLSLPMIGFGQSKSVALLAQKYKGKENVIQMDLNGSIGNFDTGKYLKESQKESLIKSINGFKFLQIPNNQALKADIIALQKGLKKENYELLAEVLDKKNQFYVYTKGDKKIQDLVVMVKDPKESWVLVEVKGDFDPKLLTEVSVNLK